MKPSIEQVKKSFIGYTCKGWINYFKEDKDSLIELQTPAVYKLSDKHLQSKCVRVRITMEEV